MLIPYSNFKDFLDQRYPYTITLPLLLTDKDAPFDWLIEHFGPYKSTIETARWVNYDLDQRWDVVNYDGSLIFYFMDDKDAALFKMFIPSEADAQ
jgi:hypothetical protein